MENELIITRDIFEKYSNKYIVDIFNEVFPHGARISEIPKLIPELEEDYSDFAEWLLKQVPPTDITLEFDTLQDNIFYNGPIHVKGDVNLVNTGIDLIGSLKIDGKLTIIGTGIVYADKSDVNADEIDISEYAYIHARIKANRIDMRGAAIISGDTKAKVVKLVRGRIYGNVDADELYNDGGYISQNAKADKATLINGGNIGGNIAFKCLYTDSNFYAQIFRAS